MYEEISHHLLFVAQPSSHSTQLLEMLRTERKPHSAPTCFILACLKPFIFLDRDKKHILKIDVVDDISILL